MAETISGIVIRTAADYSVGDRVVVRKYAGDYVGRVTNAPYKIQNAVDMLLAGIRPAR